MQILNSNLSHPTQQKCKPAKRKTILIKEYHKNISLKKLQ